MAILTVTDNGPGIPPANTERVFERFYTDRPNFEEFGQNSGLGLSITRQIIEAHGGTVKAGNIQLKNHTGAVFYRCTSPIQPNRLTWTSRPAQAAMDVLWFWGEPAYWFGVVPAPASRNYHVG